MITVPATTAEATRSGGPPVVDLLVAATAEAWGLTILHVDAELDTIARVVDVHTIRADKA